jgi:hypothetical protein
LFLLLIYQGYSSQEKFNFDQTTKLFGGVEGKGIPIILLILQLLSFHLMKARILDLDGQAALAAGNVMWEAIQMDEGRIKRNLHLHRLSLRKCTLMSRKFSSYSRN